MSHPENEINISRRGFFKKNTLLGLDTSLSAWKVNFTIGKDFGKRINRQPVYLNKEYSMVVCERESDPGDNRLCRIERISSLNTIHVLRHDVITGYLKAISPVAPKQEMKSTATDEPHTLLAQLKSTSCEV